MYDQMKRQSLARAASSKTTPTPSAQTLHSPISGEGYSYLSERARENSRSQTYNQDEMINRLITLPISRNSNDSEIRPGRRNYADLLRMQQNDTFDDFDDFDADNISANYSDADRNVGSGDTHQSNIKLPWYQKLALRYMPISWFKTRAIKKLTGYPIRPKILHNGRYRSTASFNIEKCSTDDALAISSAFKLLAENNIKWIKTMGESIPDEILKNNRLAVEMNSRLTETIGLGDDDKLYYKLTRKGAPAGEDVYALSQQSISESGEFHVDIISVNPKTFFSRMEEGDAYNSGIQSGYIDGNFSVRGLGQSIAILSTILAARKVKNGLKRVSTNALNPFSANMFNKIVKK